jgi:hypothetical protein
VDSRSGRNVGGNKAIEKEGDRGELGDQNCDELSPIYTDDSRMAIKITNLVVLHGIDSITLGFLFTFCPGIGGDP